jgi:hypothetical protein
MVLNVNKYGRLGNRLFFLSYLIANALENGYSFVDFSFEEYLKYFNVKSGYKKRIFIISKILCYNNLSCIVKYKLLPRLLKYKWFRQLSIVKEYDLNKKWYDLNQQEFVYQAKHNILAIEGYRFVDHSNIRKHSNEIRKIFQFKKKYINDVDSHLSSIKQKYDIIIGLHIRQGDYKDYLGGKYYFTSKQYLDYTDHLIRNLEPLSNINTGIVVCSDEKLDPNNFKNYNCYFFDKNFIFDLILLSKCDYIISTNSTFSAWASFYGKVPRYIVNYEKVDSSEPLLSNCYF